MLHQIEQNRCDSEKSLKNEDIEPYIIILALSIEKWQALENGGVGVFWKKFCNWTGLHNSKWVSFCTKLNQNRRDSEKSWKEQEIKFNLTYFAQFGITGDPFWLTYAILSNYRIFFKTPPTPPCLKTRHFSIDGASMLILGSMSSFFQAFSESHLFCSMWYNRRLVLTYICNPV